jgi:uncharacterized protein
MPDPVSADPKTALPEGEVPGVARSVEPPAPERAAPSEPAPGEPAPGEPAAGEPSAGEPSAGAPPVEQLSVEEALVDEPVSEPQPEPEPWSLPDPVPVFRVVDVVEVTVALPSPFPTVTLREAEPPYRTLTIPVGLPEGTALAHALYKVATPRPLTHELMVEVLQRLNTDLAAVRLVGRFSGTYIAELDLVGVRGHEVVSCRPTDGLTLALRQGVPAPVLADERLFTSEGDVPEPL